MQVEVRALKVRPVAKVGKLLALADVSLTWDELSIQICAIRIESIGRYGDGGTKVCMPVDREGRPVLILPDELTEAVAEVVLAGGLEVGVLKPRIEPND